MNYRNFINEGYLLTEREREAIESAIVKQYDTALKNIQDKMGAMMLRQDAELNRQISITGLSVQPARLFARPNIRRIQEMKTVELRR